jgi:hypothetical protein
LASAIAAVAYYVLFSILFVGDRRFQPRTPDFSSSLRERLDREIDYVTHQIAVRMSWKRVLLHLMPPWFACIVIVWAGTIRNGGPLGWIDLLSFAVVTGGWVHVYFLQRRWVRRELVPRTRELAALRKKLDEP